MPGNVHDNRERDGLPSGDETALHADAADSSRETRDELARFGIADRAPRKGHRGHPSSEADKARNAGIAAVRSGVERVFAVSKRCYGLGRTRFLGLAKNTTFYGLAAIAPDIRKGGHVPVPGRPRPARRRGINAGQVHPNGDTSDRIGPFGHRIDAPQRKTGARTRKQPRGTIIQPRPPSLMQRSQAVRYAEPQQHAGALQLPRNGAWREDMADSVRSRNPAAPAPRACPAGRCAYAARMQPGGGGAA